MGNDGDDVKKEEKNKQGKKNKNALDPDGNTQICAPKLNKNFANILTV